MNCNFEHQHLDYIVIRPWIFEYGDDIAFDFEDMELPFDQNIYTAHLRLADTLRQEPASNRIVLTVANFTDITIPYTPTREDLEQFAELALDGYPGIETSMTRHDICIAALNTIGFFPPRLWSENTERALQKLRERELKLRPREYEASVRGEFDAFDVSKALEDGSILQLARRMSALPSNYDSVNFECVEYFARHPLIPIETLEACVELSVGWCIIGRYNPNAAPLLEKIIKQDSDTESQHIMINYLLQGPNAITYDYQTIKQENEWIARELVGFLHCPHFVETWMKRTGKDADEYDPGYFSFTWERRSSSKRKRCCK